MIEDVQSFLKTHAPEWAHLPVRPFASSGTDNALYLLGEDHVLRLPKRNEAIEALRKELKWLPALVGLPLAVPELVFHGKTFETLGYDFGIFRWLQGQIATPDQTNDGKQAAVALARFLTALHHVETTGAPWAGKSNFNRGVPLENLTDKTHASIAILADEIDTVAARAIWEQGCAADPNTAPVWVHGDLKSDNLIARNGALSGVIDWGLAAVGDPAVDYAAAWTWITPEHRRTFQQACTASDDDWHRARAWALYAATISLSYYRGRSHEALCAHSRQTLAHLGLAEIAN